MQNVHRNKLSTVQIVHNCSRNRRWGQIKDAVSKQVLHTGQPKYIKYVAKKRYGVKVSL